MCIKHRNIRQYSQSPSHAPARISSSYREMVHTSTDISLRLRRAQQPRRPYRTTGLCAACALAPCCLSPTASFLWPPQTPRHPPAGGSAKCCHHFTSIIFRKREVSPAVKRYMYIPLVRFPASNLTLWYPAERTSSSTVATRCPIKLYTSMRARLSSATRS